MKGIINIELGFEQRTINVYCDSQSALYLIKNVMFHERKKYIGIKFHFIRDIVAKGWLMLLK